MRTYEIYQVDSFTKEKFRGNPAGVVLNADGLTEDEMQSIAREMNLSETAFIFEKEGEDYEVHVRYFTPSCEVPICGHATIAAHYVRANKRKLGSCTVYAKTGAGILPIEIIREADDVRIVMTQGKIEMLEIFSEDQFERLSKALTLNKSDFLEDHPVQIASTGHSKVMVGIKSVDKLHQLKPNMAVLSDLSREIGCNGFYVYTYDQTAPIQVHGRMFAPAIGILEDPVTGNANGPLGAYLVHHGLAGKGEAHYSLNVVQGEAIRRNGMMSVEVDIENDKPKLVKIIGDAVIVFKTVIELPER